MTREELVAELEWAKETGLGGLFSEEQEFACGPADRADCAREQNRFSAALDAAIEALKQS